MINRLFYSFLVIFLLLFINSYAIAQNQKNEYLSWPADSFTVVHSVDFEDNTTGIYGNYPREWEADWGDVWYAWRNNDIVEIIQKDNTKAQKFIFPEGTYDGINQGGDYTASIPGNDADSIELYLSYDVMWKPGFEFVISGKTGGHMLVGHDWAGEHSGGPYFWEGGRFGLSWQYADWANSAYMNFYFYHHDLDDAYGETKPWDDPYSDLGYYFFDTSEEKWVNITIRMVVNTCNNWENGEIGNNDGFAEGFINGRFFTRWDNLRMRNVDTIGINCVKIYAQFGGGTQNFAATRDEWLLTDNYYIWVYDWDVQDVLRHYEKSEPGRILHIPQSWTNAILFNEDTPDDNESPSVPSGLNLSNITNNSIDIQWSASTDNVGVSGYYIYLNNAKVSSTANTSYSITGLHSNTTYTIAVSAFDEAGNESAKSNPIQIILEDQESTVYIDPDNKNDVLEYGSMEHPFDSWQDVEWENGYYYRQKRGTIANEAKINVLADDISIGAYGEGNRPIIKSSAEDFALSFNERSNITINNLHIEAENAISSVDIQGNNSTNILIMNSCLEGSIYGIRTMGGNNFTIQYNVIQGCGDAISSHTSNTFVYYNIFQNNQYAINIEEENSSAEIFNNVFYDNNIAVKTEYSGLILYNNIFYLYKDFDKALDIYDSEMISDYNIFYPLRVGFVTYNGIDINNLASLRETIGTDANSFISDPLFVDASNNNFALKNESPAIDAGVFLGITSDLSGTNVPYGNGPDIGVIESDVVSDPSLITKEEDILESLNIYPNPTDGLFTITFSNPEKQSVDITIQSITGIIVLKQEYSDRKSYCKYTFDISDSPPGVYIFSIRLANSIYSKQVLKTF